MPLFRRKKSKKKEDVTRKTTENATNNKATISTTPADFLTIVATACQNENADHSISGKKSRQERGVTEISDFRRLENILQSGSYSQVELLQKSITNRGQNALHLARCQSVAKLLLRNSDGPTSSASESSRLLLGQDYDGNLPIHSAAERGLLPVVQALLEHPKALAQTSGVQPSNTNRRQVSGSSSSSSMPSLARSSSSSTSSHSSSSSRSIYENDLTHQLLTATNKRGWTPFLIACHGRHLEVARFLYEQQFVQQQPKQMARPPGATRRLPSSNRLDDLVDKYGQTALHLVLGWHRDEDKIGANDDSDDNMVAIVSWLCEVCPALLTTTDRNGATPMLLACSHGWLSVAKHLCADCQQPSAPPIIGDTTAAVPAENPKFGLLDARNRRGHSALHVAVRHKYPDQCAMVKWLVDQRPDLVHSLDRAGQNPLENYLDSSNPNGMHRQETWESREDLETVKELLMLTAIGREIEFSFQDNDDDAASDVSSLADISLGPVRVQAMVPLQTLVVAVGGKQKVAPTPFLVIQDTSSASAGDASASESGDSDVSVTSLADGVDESVEDAATKVLENNDNKEPIDSTWSETLDDSEALDLDADCTQLLQPVEDINNALQDSSTLDVLTDFNVQKGTTVSQTDAPRNESSVEVDVVEDSSCRVSVHGAGSFSPGEQKTVGSGNTELPTESLEPGTPRQVESRDDDVLSDETSSSDSRRPDANVSEPSASISEVRQNNIDGETSVKASPETEDANKIPSSCDGGQEKGSWKMDRGFLFKSLGVVIVSALSYTLLLSGQTTYMDAGIHAEL